MYTFSHSPNPLFPSFRCFQKGSFHYMSASLNFLLIRTLSYGLGERDLPLIGSYKYMEMVMKLDKFNGCVFFLGKSKNGFVISHQRILQRQKNAKFKKGLFSMTTQTNKPRVACNLQKKKKKLGLTGLFWRNSSTKMPPEKKKYLSD